MPQKQRETSPPAPLDVSRLYRRCDMSALEFETTAELKDLEGAVGQERALAAIEFATRMGGDGYNLYVLGQSGSLKHQTVMDCLEPESSRKGAASDWCYLNNFDESRKPEVLMLPAGRGAELREDMTRLIAELKEVIPATFESDHYRARVAEIQQEFEDRHKAALEELQKAANEVGVSLVPTPHGFAIAPVRDGRVLPDEEFEKLPDTEKERLTQAMAEISERVRRHFQSIPKWAQEHRERIRALNREMTELAAGQLIDRLDAKYHDNERLLEYLKAVREDVLENAREFLGQEQEPSPFAPPHRANLVRYAVNLVVDNAGQSRAPVVYEQNPSLQNLLGRVEHVAQFGALVTDFTMIRPGALHRANGGYLILDADRVLTQPFAWAALKRALFAKEIRMESAEQFLSIVTTVSLEPQPIPLDIKLILIGDRVIYYLLCELDKDFANLFKVAADFEDQIDRTDENTALYARLVATLARREHLLPVTRSGVARVIEQSARFVGDAEKLSTRLRSISDLLREADYWAKHDGVATVEADHIQRALDAQIHRVDRIRSRIQEGIQRNRILIDTTGQAVGQVNGLSVLQLGTFAFGQPSRITATVRIGDGKIIDIERETELGGPIHSKGVLIVSSYVASKYASDVPLSLAASLVFEQSYGGVEGDSASVAEICALLSALSKTPIKQSLAVTGSVNQHGKVQAIGGANEKIEGFYDVCKARGLTGDQGVLIPADNVSDLMLRDDVRESVEAGKFQVFAITWVDEAVSLLTGVDAGERDADGHFPAESVNGRVEQQLVALANARKDFAREARAGEKES